MNRRQFRSAKSAMQQFQSDSLDRSESRCSFLYGDREGSRSRINECNHAIDLCCFRQLNRIPTRAQSWLLHASGTWLSRKFLREKNRAVAAVTVRGTLLLKKTSSSLRPHWNVDSANHQRRRALRWFLTAIIFSLPFIDAKLHPAIAAATPAALPGTVQAEDFDDGAAGVAYRDTTSGNSGGQYRSTDVDIESDVG